MVAYQFDLKYSEGALPSSAACAGAFSGSSQSMVSRMKGTQPIPLSTETILSFGKRSKTPEKMVLMTTRALPMKSIAPPMAGLTNSSWDGQKYWPKKFIAVRLAPMWKWIGSSRSAQTSHRGSQATLARSGEPRSWGSKSY